MSTKSRFHMSTEGLNLGDHLISSASEITRHGIYVGRCRVISVKSGIVSAELLDEFCCGSTVNIYLQKSDYSAAEVVRRAESQIGNMIAPLDDQSFCDWCLRGLRIMPTIY